MDHIHFAQGFVTDVDETREDLLNEAIELAKSSEVAVIFAGLPDSSESEFYDRTHMKLPNCQNELIKQVGSRSTEHGCRLTQWIASRDAVGR